MIFFYILHDEIKHEKTIFLKFFSFLNIFQNQLKPQNFDGKFCYFLVKVHENLVGRPSLTEYNSGRKTKKKALKG